MSGSNPYLAGSSLLLRLLDDRIELSFGSKNTTVDWWIGTSSGMDSDPRMEPLEGFLLYHLLSMCSVRCGRSTLDSEPTTVELRNAMEVLAPILRLCRHARGEDVEVVSTVVV